MPARPIEDEHDLLAGTGSRLARELGEFDFEERDADRGRQVEDGPTRGGMDKADQIAPREAVLNNRRGALPNGCPHPTQQWLEANAMFVRGPQLNAGVRKRRRDRLQQRSYLFLKRSCSCGSAKACCGRGAC